MKWSESIRNEESEDILIEIEAGPGDLATAWDWYLELVQWLLNSAFGFNTQRINFDEYCLYRLTILFVEEHLKPRSYILLIPTFVIGNFTLMTPERFIDKTYDSQKRQREMRNWTRAA